MKKIIYGLGIFILSMSCKQEAPAVDYAIVSGKITNLGSDILTISSMDRSFKDTIQVSDDGTFIDTLRNNFGEIVLYNGKNPAFLHLQVNNNIQVNYDSNDFDKTLAISGVGAETSNYLLNKSRIMKKMQGDGTSYFELEEEAYKNRANEIKSAYNVLLDSTKGLPEEYIEKEKRNIDYEYLSDLNKYEPYHAHYAKIEDFKVSEGFLNELDGVDYSNEEDFKFSNFYSGLVSGHYSKKVSEMIKADSTLSRDLAFLNIAKDVENETIKNSLLYDFSKYNITYTDEIEIFYKTFMDGSTNNNHKEEITKTYNKLKNVAKGQPSPKFVGYENHSGGTTSLEDLKGKYVYIDVWATWCGPCIGEIPSLKKVEKAYHGKNVEFVSLSIDNKKDHDKWKEMVTEKELGGIQLYADNAWNSKFVQDYQIKGIPRFILIDPQGNIVNANAPRPSDKKLITLFDELKI